LQHLIFQELQVTDSHQRQKPGPGKPLTAQRELYFRLMKQGLNNSEACRLVGIHRSTGQHWRHGRRLRNKGREYYYRPITALPTPGSARFLSEDERVRIADLHRLGWSTRVIARKLGRDPSTISRELRRNADPVTGSYRPFTAHRRALGRRPRPRPAKLAVDVELRTMVQQLLNRRWSPEQISHELRRRFPDRPERHLVPETIYQAIYVQGRGGLRRELHRALRTGRAMRRPRRGASASPTGTIPGMVLISQRPAEVADRAVPGHWEGDLIVGASHGSVIGTLVERSTRYLMLLHLPEGGTAAAVRDALITTLGTLPTQLRRSLTWDQGKEMARHREFSLATDIAVYFCDPHSPWQRGSNENTNGLLRQYFPKGTDLSIHSPVDLAAVAAELNTRPRKTLNWQTPAERLNMLLLQAN
jgi:transposase, IS30 family